MKTMILAAGRGERLRPLTDTIPKPLLKAGGKPLIAHVIERLARAGFTELVVNLGYLGDKIEQELEDGRAFGVKILYSREPEEALETGGGIFKALPYLSDPFLAVNADIATDFPFVILPKAISGLAHLVLVPNPAHHPQGDFALTHGKVGLEGEKFTFSGIGVYRLALFAGCRPGRFPLAPILRQAIAQGQVSGQLYLGFWSDLGTLERLEAFDRRLKKGGELCAHL